MIKQYGSHLIPERKSPLPYSIISADLPRGRDFRTPMYLKNVLQSSIRYYHCNREIRFEFFDYTNFDEHIKFKLPTIRKDTYVSYFRFFDNIFPLITYFKSEDYAYIDMFLNSKLAKREYPDKYQQVLQQYPEYFI